jgi:hypothetical protein
MQFIKRNFTIKLIAMKQPYLKVDPLSNYTKDLFKFSQALNLGMAAHSVKSLSAGEKGNTRGNDTKNDSFILYDFFGALNY